jgi:hypothetical protein
VNPHLTPSSRIISLPKSSADLKSDSGATEFARAKCRDRSSHVCAASLELNYDIARAKLVMMSLEPNCDIARAKLEFISIC